MNTDQINKILSRNRITKNAYLGCFPSDKIPEVQNFMFPQCMCINTANSSSIGEHWVGIWVQSPEHMELYDSLAQWPPHSPGIMAFVSKFPKKNIKYLPPGMNFQHLHSNACGAHVCHFLYRRSSGFSFEQIIDFLLAILLKGRGYKIRILKSSCSSLANFHNPKLIRRITLNSAQGREAVDCYVKEFIRKCIFKN